MANVPSPFWITEMPLWKKRYNIRPLVCDPHKIGFANSQWFWIAGITLVNPDVHAGSAFDNVDG